MEEINFIRPDGAVGARITFPDSDSIEELIVSPQPDSCFRLEETPVFSEFASYGDTIQADVARDGLLVCQRVVARSGLTTIRWLVSEDFIESATWSSLQDRLMACGGNWEQVFGGCLILHIPKDSIAAFDDIVEQARLDSGDGAGR